MATRGKKYIFEGKSHELPSLQLITNVLVIDGTNTPARKASRSH